MEAGGFFELEFYIVILIGDINKLKTMRCSPSTTFCLDLSTRLPRTYFIALLGQMQGQLRLLRKHLALEFPYRKMKFRSIIQVWDDISSAKFGQDGINGVSRQVDENYAHVLFWRIFFFADRVYEMTLCQLTVPFGI